MKQPVPVEKRRRICSETCPIRNAASLIDSCREIGPGLRQKTPAVSPASTRAAISADDGMQPVIARHGLPSVRQVSATDLGT